MPTATTPVLITGAAGYIGSHACRVLAERGYEPIGLDNLSTGFAEALLPGMTFYECDAGDSARVSAIIGGHGIRDVIHFAGSVINSESIEQAAFYYENNSFQTLRLLEACEQGGVERFLYSSSAGVYGDQSVDLLAEDSPCAPLTPYGNSKYISERFLADVSRDSAMRYGALRYFNVVGADIERGIGQRSRESTHILKIICEALTSKREGIALFGTDYPTPDGSCIRDYVHVLDLVDAHIAVLEYLREGGDSTVMNCGYGHGYSVREIIQAAQRVAGASLSVSEAPRRVGDPARLIAANEKILSLTQWRPQRDDLEQIIASALAWERNLT